jgi:hypothetical protein
MASAGHGSLRSGEYEAVQNILRHSGIIATLRYCVHADDDVRPDAMTRDPLLLIESEAAVSSDTNHTQDTHGKGARYM